MTPKPPHRGDWPTPAVPPELESLAFLGGLSVPKQMRLGVNTPDALRVAADRVEALRAERDEAHRTLARITQAIGPDYVSMEGGPLMAVDLDVMEAVSGLIKKVNAQADEASRARGEAARLREEVARLRAVVRS